VVLLADSEVLEVLVVEAAEVSVALVAEALVVAAQVETGRFQKINLANPKNQYKTLQS
jgi:hypothetical protein